MNPTAPRAAAGRPSRGFTLVELLVCLAIIGVLSAFLLSVVQRVRDTASSATCVSNLRQWGIAMNLYASEHNGVVPRRGQGIQPVQNISRPEDWFNCLPPYLGMASYEDQVKQGHPARPGDKSVFVCPSAKDSGNHPHFICYGMNIYLSPWIRPEPHRLLELPEAGRLAFMADAPGGWASTVPSKADYSVQPRHFGQANVVFVDGHVQTFAGSYLGCGTGGIDRNDVRWQTLTGGVNLPFTP